MATENSHARTPMQAFRRTSCALAVLGVCATASFPVRAEVWTITPSVELNETYSSNMTLSSSAAQGGWISTVAPTITIDGSGNHLNAHLDFQASSVSYSGHPEWSVRQNKLTSFATLEAVDNWLYLDASANVGYHNLTAFSPSPIDRPVAAQTQVETRTAQISPYIKGKIGDLADYVVRLNAIDSESEDPTYANTTVAQSTGVLKKTPTGGLVGWYGDFSTTHVRNSVVQQRQDNRYRVGAIIPVIEHVNVTVSTGQETTDFASNGLVTMETPGLGIEWSPSPHFSAAATAERRFFGDAYSVQLIKSSSIFSMRFSESRDISVFPTILVGYNPGAIYNLMSQLLESSIADPFQRGVEVRSKLKQIGSAANVISSGGAETSRFYIDHVRELAFALQGKRDSLTLVIQKREEDLADFAPSSTDIFSQSGGIHELNFNVAWLHRATETLNLITSVSRLNTVGQSAPFLESVQTSYALTGIKRLNNKLNASLGVRSTLFDGGAAPIRDNSIYINITKAF